MKYRKRPAVVEAFQYNGDLKDSDGEYHVPQWAVEAFENGVIFYEIPVEIGGARDLFIKASRGAYCVSIGDYIIQGVHGEIYPCKRDIFEKTYVRVEVGIGEHK